MTKLINREVKEAQILGICRESGILFNGWFGGYTNSKSKLDLSCEVCDYSWYPRADNFIRPTARSCPACTGKARWTQQERETQITKRCEQLGYNFTGWKVGYTNKDSICNFSCSRDNCSWSTSIHHFLSSKTGCPSCASVGFNPLTPASFYIQELSYQGTKLLKFGITGKKVDERMRQQNNTSRCTHKILLTREFPIGSTTKELEQIVKKSGIPLGVITREVLPDGYTETCNYRELPKLLLLVQDFIG